MTRRTSTRYGIAPGALVMLGMLVATGSACAEPPFALDDPEVVAAGKKRFNQACFYCHGQDGSGGKGGSLQQRTDLQPQAVFDTISNGRVRGSSVMPPWKGGLTPEQIWQLTAYIMSLRQAGP